MKRFFIIMFVCACALFGFVGNAAAQLANGDIITISSGTNYLAVNGNNIARVQNNPTKYCLWEVIVVENQYAFKNVGNSSRYLRVEANYKDKDKGQNKGWTITLQTTDVTNSRSSFTLDGKKMYYTAISGRANAKCYIRYNTDWTCSTTETDNGTDLTIEKWELKSEKGEVKITATANSSKITFDKFVDDNTADSQDITVTVSGATTKEKEYYQNLNNSSQTIPVSEKDVDATFEISDVYAVWDSNGNDNIYSSAICEVFGESASTKRNLLKIDSFTPSQDNKSCTISVSTVGKSPMEMKTNDGKWTDHSDILVVTFRDGATEAAYRANISVTRYSFHAEKLPELEVSVNPTSDEFLRTGGSRNYTFTCVHQHGVVIAHMYNKDGGGEGATEGLTSYIYDQARTELSIIKDSDPLTATFSLKNTNDETNASWGIALGGITDNVLSLTAPANTTGLVRTARLVGTFTYADGDDTHTKVIVVPITQNAKDGGVKFHHQKGYYNTDFGKNTITGAAEQQVHTAEKTIYYLPNETIALVLLEPRFTAYQRWYDYETDGDPQWNLNAADQITWVRKPTGTDINPQVGNSFGIYNRNSDAYDPESRNDVIPKFKAWNYNTANLQDAYHTLACDLSHYTDLAVSSTDITEPTLSYRQLWHFRPAKEMAAKLDACTGDTYLETHYYTAPTGTDVYLATDYHHSLNKTFNGVNIFATQNSYFYDANNPKRIDAENLTWYSGNTTLTKDYDAKDFQTVSSTTVGTITYYLRASVGGKTLNIAKFVVNYVNKSTHGPTTTQIISRDSIVNKYDVLAEIDFNYVPLPTNATTNTQFHRPLPWGESTYGYYYPNGGLANDNHSNRRGSNIPYYGEYALLNHMNASWATGTAHGGGTTGYALFVDGTTEPGLVASISTDAVVCSGQTMYCSMWLLNPRKSGQTNGASNPIFRCNIQGRNSGDTEWQDVGTYFVGAVEGGGKSWHQVVFPIESEISYDETRVQIYNFGEGGNGNDFMVDDICLYASPLPLATYHQTTGCTSYADGETTSTVVVLRIDYSQLQFAENAAIRNVYYQIVDVTDTDSVILELKDADDKSLYYHEGNASDATTTYGYISVPTTVDKSIEEPNVDAYIEELTALGYTTTSGKCFVQNPITKKWYLYLVQMIPNGDGGDRDKYLDRDRQYILRVSYDAGELEEADCVFTSEVLAKQDTYLQLRNEEVDSLRITSCLGGVCANDHHFLDLKVSNAISPTIGGTMETYEALVHADWLRGFEDDDVYCDEKIATTEQIKIADSIFINNYGCTRAAVKSAIVAMRQIDGLNYTVDDPDNLQVDTDHGFDKRKLELIRNLCNKGLLQLYKKTVMFYLGSEASARYWVYPVAENATVMVNGAPVPLQDCDEPKWVKITSAYSEYGVNLSPIDLKDQTQHQRLDVPTIRVLEGTEEEITIPIKQLLGETQISTSLSTTKENIVFNFKTPEEHVLEYVDISNNTINIVDAPNKLEPGTEYLMRMAFYDKDGNIYIKGDTTQCRVGYIYFYIMTVPNRMEWTGARSNEWGDDRNWSGGRAPLPGSNVIIPADAVRYPVVGTTDLYPMDVNYYPNACNDIYFEPGAMIGNQHLLQYNRAFVDMTITPATWNSMAPPLKGMYTGDMYVPHSGNWESGTNLEYKNTTDNNQYPFVVNSFKGARTSSAAYAFWQSIYNKRVPTYHDNGNQSYPAITEDAKFVETNSLGHPLTPGTGYQVLGYGPENISGDIIVRLPKPDTYYQYFTSTGSPSDQGVSVTHSPKLAFEPNANGDMYITLTNALASNQFMFGNPAMANIDMAEFLKDNESVLAKKYSVMNNSTWEAFAEASPLGELAPMRSALLELASGTATSVTVKLSKSHFVGYTDPAPADLPARRNSATEDSDESMLMTIYAINDGGQARCMLAAKSSASDIYENQEDVLFFSSGVEQGGDGSTATSPINMYTVAQQVPMMVDVRANIDTVPVSMLVHDSYRTEKVKFAFYLSLNWDKECYFWDSKTDEKFRILDGLWLEMDMPENHEPRYFIIGPDMRSDNDDNVTTSTTNPSKPEMGAEINIWAYSPEQGKMVVTSNDIIKAVNIYDPSGRLIAQKTLDLQYNSTSVSVPAGVYVVEATMRDNSKQFTQAVVW